MGAISDLVDWASALAEKHGQWRTFADWAKDLADRGNLKALTELCETAQRNHAAAQSALAQPDGVTAINSDQGTEA